MIEAYFSYEVKMKLNVFLFSSIFLLASVGIKAQPGSPPIFNPFYICQYSNDPVDHIFYGEIVSVTEFNENVKINTNDYYNGARFKSVVKVIKSFEEASLGEIEVYFDWRFVTNRPLANNRYIFRTKDAFKDGSKQNVKQLSEPITNYSKKAVEEVFKNVNSVVNNEKKDFVEGILLERLLQITKRNLRNEQTARLIYDPDSNIPISKAQIEFVDDKTGKSYSVKTKSDGSFRIDKMQAGNYKVNVKVENMKLETPSLYFDHTVCSSKWFISMIHNK